ncbi:MAG: hypothetical protein E5V86_16440 [Mesorhizobium sp.]|nr:MAG: hypothetical protein E5V86_16440 [Mesorhizobium sp.]
MVKVEGLSLSADLAPSYRAATERLKRTGWSGALKKDVALRGFLTECGDRPEDGRARPANFVHAHKKGADQN